jgi:hypothetical protein
VAEAQGLAAGHRAVGMTIHQAKNARPVSAGGVDEEANDEDVQPISYSVLNVMAERCGECLFSGGAIIEGDARRELIEECRERDTFFVCHKATIEGGLMICCRGYYDANDTTPIQLANRLQRLRFIRAEQLPILNPLGRKTVTPDIAFLLKLYGKEVPGEE